MYKLYNLLLSNISTSMQLVEFWGGGLFFFFFFCYLQKLREMIQTSISLWNTFPKHKFIFLMFISANIQFYLPFFENGFT